MNIRIIPILIISLFLTTFASAQFLVEKNDNQTTEVGGNLHFSSSQDNVWTVGGIDISDVKQITRVKRNGPVVLDREEIVDNMASSMYFGDTYENEKGLADYYVILVNDELGSISSETYSQNYPCHPGGYRVILDCYGPLSADRKNAVLPEGTYTVSATKGHNVLNTGLSWACLNTDGSRAGLKEIFFEDGTLTVEHTADGGYAIKGDIITDKDETFSFVYNGKIHFVDCTGVEDPDMSKYITEDITVSPVTATDIYCVPLSTDSYDEHALMLFSTDDITSDGQHCNAPGVKLDVSFLSQKGQIAGTYTLGKLGSGGWTRLDERPGVFYPGFYMGTIPTNTYLEQVTDDLSVKTAIVTDGTFTITDNGDGTYTVDADFVTANPETSDTYTAKCKWTGKIETTTLQ